MKSLFSLLTKHIEARGYKSFNAFLREHDPKASAFQALIKNSQAVPRTERVAKWCEILKLNAGETREIMECADRERVFAAEDGKELGPGIKLIRADLAALEGKLADSGKDKVRLEKKLAQILAELNRRGIRLDDPQADGG